MRAPETIHTALESAAAITGAAVGAGAPTFQDIILRLQQYWGRHGCLLWQPTNTEVGAGTNNPATFLRVLGPEPWRVAYVEPSVRPDDSRYGENPNRIQMHTQFQVVLKPAPSDPQELYLSSLRELGIDPAAHDLRFVEDNWAWPAGGAWGLGWEVWLDGQEITQFTYFQQMGGVALDPVAVEITYGLERIAMALQGAKHFKEIRYAAPAGYPPLTYGEVLGQNEEEQSAYNLELADAGRLAELFGLYEAEARVMLDAGQVLPAYGFALKTSHTFNLLDARGALGVTERTRYLGRVRDLALGAAGRWLEKRAGLGFPLGRADSQVQHEADTHDPRPQTPTGHTQETTDFLLEIGTEELPAADLERAVASLSSRVPAWLDEVRLAHGDVWVAGTPRRLVVRVRGVQTTQPDEERVIKGPPAGIAFDAAGRPTPAAQGFARRRGLEATSLRAEEVDGGVFAVARVLVRGRPARAVLAEAVPMLLGGIEFAKTMRWNASGAAFSRPIRWLVALLGEHVVPCAYAGVASGRTSRGLRPDGSPPVEIAGASHYERAMAAAGIVLDGAARAAAVREGASRLAGEVSGVIVEDGALVAEVANLVEAPTLLRGVFDGRFLTLPRDVLVTVMRKHQRYFAVERAGVLLPAFVVVANGPIDAETVRRGNEAVLAARYADAAFFWERDRTKRLEERVPQLARLTFQAQLGSLLDKTDRIERLTPRIAQLMGLGDPEATTARRIARLAKADLATQMVAELTSLQGVMGREYARHDGEPEEVATGIYEHSLPRHAGDALPVLPVAIAVGVADRLDTLVGLFAAGLAPRATADPLALRRTALGLVQILVERALDLDLRAVVGEAAALQPIAVTDTTRAEVLAFVRRRLEQWLLDGGSRPDVVQAVLAARPDNPARAAAAVRELAALVDTPEFRTVHAAHARAARIVRGQRGTDEVDTGLFSDGPERALWEALLRAQQEITPAASVGQLVKHFWQLVEPIDSFFDQVHVMTEGDRLRGNRLALLRCVADLANGIVDLTQLRVHRNLNGEDGGAGPCARLPGLRHVGGPC